MNNQVVEPLRRMLVAQPSNGSTAPLMVGGNSAEAGPLLATAAEVAKMIRISPRTLWRLVSADQVPEPLRIGGAVRWRVDDIKQWIGAGCPAQEKVSERRRKR